MIEHKGWYFPDNESHFLNSVGDYPATTYQQSTVDTAFKLMRNNVIALDIGANVGLHTVRFSNKFEKVFAFEPAADNFLCLRENTKNLHNVTLYNNGVGNSETFLDIKIPQDAINCGAYSIVDFENYNGPLKVERIKVITIDSLNLTPDLIKIDTQGFEEYVLLGASSTLEKSSPVIITECENKDQLDRVSKLLTKYSFKLQDRIRKDYIWIK